MKLKWYLQTWFICLVFFFWIFGIPFIIGILLIILQNLHLNKLAKFNETKFVEFNKNNEILNNTINILQNKLEQSNQNICDINNNFLESQQTNENLKNTITMIQNKLNQSNNIIDNNSKIEQNNQLLNNTISTLQNELEQSKELVCDINNNFLESQQTNEKLKNTITIIQNKLNQANSIIDYNNDFNSELYLLEKKIILRHYQFSDYDALTSQECKNQLSILKEKELNLIKDDKVINIIYSQSKKTTNNNIKKILRNFNADCDNILLNLKVKNIDSCRSKIQNSYNSLNKIFEIDGISINMDLLSIKLEELNLVYTFELKKQQEIEQQKAIKEQMIQEEKARKEIANKKLKLKKEESQFKNEVNKLISYIQKTHNDIEKTLYLEKIKKLEEKLSAIEKDNVNMLERETNTRAGFVYIISNIGSFGDNIYKIGMTRRLEPMDRINELGNASVPFPFDVHAIIFSDDAPSLENLLHKKFEKNSVNKVNFRKEFFNIELENIKKFVLENCNNTVKFTTIPIAEQYRQSISKHDIN